MDNAQQAIATLLGRFAEQVRTRPLALAVIDRQAPFSSTLSYAELAAASERIAHALLALGVGPGQSLALCMPRSWRWLAAIIGALKVGAVVVPLDRASPSGRQTQILEDSGCVGLLVDEALAQLSNRLWQADVSTLLEHVAETPLALPDEPAAVSFLFYTSGSTGTPKAVEVGERGLLRLVQSGGYIDIRPGDRFACLANPAFDAISFELWAPLLNGGTCVIVADDDLLDARQLAHVLEAQRVDNLFMTVSLFNTLARQYPRCFACLRHVLIGGEQISAVAVRDWYRANPDSACQIFNVYGPTECTTFALCQPIARHFSGASVPIGRPLPDTGVRILDEQQRPVTPGTVGELYLSGSGVAQGYRQRPEETARCFLVLPDASGQLQRHYRTGDRVRENESGLIEYVGRADRQVKVRGFRIEPGEVEQRIIEHPGVAQAYVCTRRQAAEDHQLLAFIVPRGLLEHADFDAYLQAQLPGYMRPHHLFLLERLPLTANGKVDRERLLEEARQPWRAPRPDDLAAGNEEGAELSWLLAQVRTLLGQPQLGAGDDWLGSGGDSLKALRLRSAIRQRWQVELSMLQLLGEPFAGLAAKLSEPQGSSAAYPPAPSPSSARRLPATAEQRRLWLLQQREPDSTAYNVPMILHLPASVDLDALGTAVGQLVERHGALRTRFVAGPEGLDQLIDEQGTTCRRLPRGQFTEDNWQAFAELVFATPFDLGTATLFQSWLLPFADGSARLLLHLHHTVVDGWSLNLLFDDLLALYGANRQGDDLPVSAVRLTPLEFGQWQRQWSVDPYYRQQRRALAQFHREQPPASPALVAPRRVGGAQARQYRQHLEPALCAALERFCVQRRLTRFEVLFSVFAWSLYALTGLSRPRIASPVSNRPLAEFEDVVGMFANTVLIPTAVEGQHSLDELLREQTDLLRQVLALQDVALADVVEDLRLSGKQTLFDFMFVLENTDFAKLDRLQARLEFSGPVQAKCPLTLSLVDSAQGLTGWWEYQCDYFDQAQVQTAADGFRDALDRLLTASAQPLDRWLLPYRQRLPAASRGESAQPAFATLAGWFEHQVRCTPQATALVGGQQRLNYRHLNELADTLAATLSDAAHLPPLGETPGPVLLFLDTSVEHIVALLALAKLNLTAVPLDPAYPQAVLRQVLVQSGADRLLFSESTRAALEQLGEHGIASHRVDLDAPARVFTRTPHQGERPLYMLFTSGSTGTPKGVQVSDRTLCNLLHWQRGAGGLAARAQTLQFSMLSFDVSFQEIFSTLCGGGCYHLIVPAWRQDAPALLEYLLAADIERLFMPCVALQHLAETAVNRGIYPTRLREVITAGEQLLCTDTLRNWFAGMPQASLFNHYGPTETHVVCGLRLEGGARDWPLRASIGRAVSNACLLLVDEHDRPLPSGIAGYLLVAGPMVARCYLGDPTLNSRRFVELPDGSGGVRLFYRTGDLARVDAEGCLHYLGRDDQQIKLSGHRLELGQIEAALMQEPEVSGAVVTLEAESAKLNAYLQLDGTSVTAEALDRRVALQLPAQVRIDAYWRIEQWPRTPSGKVDRKALPGLGERLERQATHTSALATNPLERRLGELFEAVIGRPIGLDQSFFEAGATSLGLMRLHARYNQEDDLQMSMADLFEQVSIRRLAAHLASTPAEIGRQARAGELVQSPMAVIGMAVNVAGAPDLRAFWAMVQAGESGVELFDAGEGLVGARSQLAAMLDFDPEYFGISRQEARLMDPQQRHLLMACVQALEHAALVPSAQGPRIGLIASCGETTYFQQLLRQADETELPDGFQMALHHDKDFLATKAAYHLNLNGPAMSVQAACGSSLIGVHLAAALLRQGDAEVMLAAGVLVDPTLTDGYRYRPQHIFSRDGQCRPFSDDASGTLGASGYGVVVLKPLARAQRDGDRIYGVIEASALNNDGRDKMSYTAPSVAGQSAVIAEALDKAGLRGVDIGYVEAHGTGTLLGDPIEVAALSKAFGAAPTNNCALASVKSQIGHLGAAAGVVGLIRATLAVYHGVLPANLGFNRINPQIDLQHTPFYIPTRPHAWPEGRRRVAGVSSFGIGGTNAHVIVAAAPAVEPATAPGPACLLISAHSRSALLRNIAAIKAYRDEFPDQHEALLRFLQSGRRQQRWRYGVRLEAGGQWLVEEALIREVPLSSEAWPAQDATPEDILRAWYEGARIVWPKRSAAPPWNLPPSAFDLETCRFQPTTVPSRISVEAAPAAARKALPDWFYQRQWVRVRRLEAGPVNGQRGTLVVCTAEALAGGLLEALGSVYERVVEVRAGNGLRRLSADRFELDPADAQALSTLLAELLEPRTAELDWLHALPLSVSGKVNEQSLAGAQWACLDTPSALLQAWGAMAGETRLRLWLLSAQACAVDGAVRRPELGALAGVCEVAPQEYPLRVHWLDLQSAQWASQAVPLATLLGNPTGLPRRLAVRDGYLWQPRLIASPPTTPLPASALLPPTGTFLVLGGNGGIGSSLCEHLLQAPGRRVVVLSRRGELPPNLLAYRERVDNVLADITDLVRWPAIVEQLAQRYGELAGVIHAAGIGAGSLIRNRDARQMDSAMAAKTLGMLAVEALIARLSPGFVLYCSSMSALLGGAGHLDYAAANAVLDGFAQYQPDTASTCVRMGLNWDIWRERGMATAVSGADEAHQRHLAVGLSVEEGAQVFDLVLALQWPQCLVSTTSIEASRQFYPQRHKALVSEAAPAADDDPDPAVHLRECLCQWLGVDALEDEDSLYELGADSLTLLDLIDEVQSRLGVGLQLSQFSPRVSLREILALLGGSRTQAPVTDWARAVQLDVWNPGAGRDWLCLVHPVGGDVQAYRELAAALPETLGVCVIADPLLQHPQLPTVTIEQRAAHYLQALQTRLPHQSCQWRLAGWSFGAWVAQAMCAQAYQAGLPQPLLYLIDPPAPDAGAELARMDARDIEQVFQREFSQRWPQAAEQGLSGEMQVYLQRLTTCCQHNMASMGAFTPAVLPGTCTRLFVARQANPYGVGRNWQMDQLKAAWQTLLPQLLDWQTLDTDHYGIVAGYWARLIGETIGQGGEHAT
ncbi:hybrid non-ribosomal peptide synthetase/type I polyketide synthase [Pseudomonas asplenii]|uniref:hybrid non-ribosomal peptide synthetase/type I polyketide synthase n=1 Tax=Pseudomonas asplenii TaxID=53407 RepID=UPI0022341D87|nr:hybrid non-ribosomal peptide synthetase/type I polyketide synthase [Pseudomonas asplenii]UZE26698.1 amino acid adenylation domain-containing protein [Pseudomonas asplenii]